MAGARRHPAGKRAHALPGSRHGLRVQPGGLRHGLPVLRYRPGRPAAQPVHGGDRGTGPGGGRDGQGRRPGAAGPAVQRGVHGHGRAAGQLPAHGGRGPPDLRPGPRRLRHLTAVCHRLDRGFGISQRSVTVSTVGLVPAIRRLAGEGLSVTLAVSLHAPDDELRDELVPVNTRWKVAEVLDAARDYAGRTGRRVSVEYALIRDVNDQPWRADLLGSLLHRALGPLVHVNAIPLNPTPGSRWDASPKLAEQEFVRRVNKAGVSCTVRDTRGREIAAACGQLAAADL